jgi:hypothetical protein
MQTEFAGAAAAFSTPPTAAPAHWITDTGATSHMTPNRHWFKEYKPCKVPVGLADNNLVYAAGVGSIVFCPRKNGPSSLQIEFTNVLHVPLLANNLLSVLTLTKNHNFEVNIKQSTMSFLLKSQLVCQAVISEDNSALLDGFMVVQAANRVSSLSPELWHRRFCHIGQDRLKQLISGSFVKDLDVSPSQSSPLPDIFKFCLAGKHHRFPFPHSASN